MVLGFQSIVGAVSTLRWSIFTSTGGRTMSTKTYAERSSNFRNAIDDLKSAYYEAEIRVEELEAENERLRKIIEDGISKTIDDFIEASIKGTLKAFNTPENQAAGKVFKDFIANHQKGEKDVR
jgi:hypothetical protein